MSQAFIYALIDPRTTEIRYVGKAFDVKHRLACHWHETRRTDTTRKCNWIKNLKAQGFKPEIDVLESFDENEISEWQEAERWWIAYLKSIGCNLTNLCSGGREGNRMSIEARRKVSESQKGKTVTQELRDQISRKLKGRKLTREHAEKIAASNRGKSISETHKAILSFVMKGRKPSPVCGQKLAQWNRSRRGIRRTPRPNWVREKLRVSAKRQWMDRAITADGKTMSRSEWAKELGVSITPIANRIKKGMTHQQTVDDIRSAKCSN